MIIELESSGLARHSIIIRNIALKPVMEIQEIDSQECEETFIRILINSNFKIITSADKATFVILKR